MENYNLESDEVPLYNVKVILVGKKENTELIVTNKNLVLITKYKKILSEDKIEVLKYPISTIKIYKGMPQIIKKENIAEIFLLDTEIEIGFASKSELHKFISVINHLITGESSVQRVAKKVKNAINIVNDTVGFNVIQTTTNLLTNNIVGSVGGIIGKIAKTTTKNKK